MTRSLALATSTLAVLTLSAGMARAQQPLGFERFVEASVETGVDFGLTELEVFDKYAGSLPLGLPGTEHPQKHRRLIDIEIRPDGSGQGVHVYDVVWVENAGPFHLDSWFLPDQNEQQVKSLQNLRGVVILDIERYPRGQSWRYSVILQPNHADTPWKLLLDTSVHAIVTAMNPPGATFLFRPVDIDSKGLSCKSTLAGYPQFCDDFILDAVLIERSGVNAVTFAAPLVVTPDVYALIDDANLQLVDHELSGGNGALGSYLDIFIQSGLPFQTAYWLTTAQVENHHVEIGRVVDLECELIVHSPQSNETVYNTVHLVNPD